MRHKLHSINALVFAGFVLVALPLVIALWTTHTRLAELAAMTGEAFDDGVRAAREAQLLAGELTQYERNARQYRVVPDQTYLTLVTERHVRLRDALDTLAPLAATRASDVRLLREALADTVSTLEADPSALDVAVFDEMHAAAGRIVGEVNARIDASVTGTLQAVADTRRQSLLHVAAMVPLTVLLGIVFALLIARPLRGLGGAIRQLGGGNFSQPVRVSGAADIQALGRHLDWLRVELAEVEREKSRFLTHVSHELKTPLANIREGSELLLDGSCGALTPTQLEIAQILRDNGVSLQKSIENLLNYNAWQDKGAGPVRKLTDVATMVARVVDNHRLALQRDELEVLTDVRNLELWIDAEKIEVMLDNLLSNAIKFSPPGGTIRVAIKKGRKRTAIIDVRDDGPGVPESERHRVFDAFFQGKTPQRGHVKGTGIGLSVVRESARLHGGTAQVVAGEHDGGHFRVTLADARDH